jgi:hypothetical protein
MRSAAYKLLADKDGVFPNVAKAGGSQSQDAKGEAVALYCDPLATPDLASSGFPGRVKK